MLVVGITGGIGSGKSYVCNVFARLGVPIYSADERAKIISDDSKIVKSEIIREFGDSAYSSGKLNRSHIASIVFKNSELLNKLNKIIHPAVEIDFKNWCTLHQDHSYILKEAAILFETGIYKKLDKTIAIIALEQTRLKRVLERDNSSEEDVLNRMKNQWSAEKIRPLADFVIENDINNLILPQILDIDKKLRN